MSIYPLSLFDRELNLAQAETVAQAIDATQQGDRDRAVSLWHGLTSGSGMPQALAWAELMLLQPLKIHHDQAVIEKLLTYAQPTTQPLIRARVAHALTIAFMWRQDYQQAFSFAFDALTAYREKDNTVGQSYILDTLGNLCIQTGDTDRALLFLVESLTHKYHAEDNLGVAISLGSLARLCFQLGRLDQARTFALRDLSLVTESQKSTQALLFNLLSRIETAAGNFTQSLHYLEQADNSAQSSEQKFFNAKERAMVFHFQNDDESANHFLQVAHAECPANSHYHAIVLQLCHHQIMFDKEDFDASGFIELESVLMQRALPEQEIEFRILWARDFYRQDQFSSARDQLLLAHKVMKSHSCNRFRTEIQSLMMQWRFNEALEEESAKRIDHDLKDNNGYVIRKTLGEGGFGVVYLAWDIEREQDVALKQFKSHLQMSVEEQQQLWRQARLEFEAAAQIKSSFVARPLAIGHDSYGVPYVVHQYIEGQPLYDYMSVIADPNSVAMYIRQIAMGLQFIHQAGIVHRDIKPDNILITSSGSPVIIDLGIALMRYGEGSKTIAGTSGYMPPEQLESTELSGASDVYALGCVFYQWLSKGLPQPAQQKAGILDRLRNKSIPGIMLDQKLVPAKWWELINAMVSIDPSDRPAIDDIIQQLN